MAKPKSPEVKAIEAATEKAVESIAKAADKSLSVLEKAANKVIEAVESAGEGSAGAPVKHDKKAAKEAAERHEARHNHSEEVLKGTFRREGFKKPKNQE